MPKYQILSRSPIFAGLLPARIEQLMGNILFQVKKYPKDYLVASMGDKLTHLLIIQKGSVKGEMMDYSGKTLKIEDIDAPRPLATAFLFGSNNVFPVSVTTHNRNRNLIHSGCRISKTDADGTAGTNQLPECHFVANTVPVAQASFSEFQEH
jgi:CRP/FNR family transcriptional regulator, dissimilatory nitrate respiration regulator